MSRLMLRRPLRRRAADQRLRVAFFALYPTDNMASWTFCEWPAEHSASLGIDGRVFAPSAPGLNEALTRRGPPGWRLRSGLYWYLIVFPRRLMQLLRAARSDVIFIQRGMLRAKSIPFLERLAAKLCRGGVVYHLDDALWVLKRNHYQERCRLADRVITGNNLVIEFAQLIGAPVTKIEYPVDVQRYKVHRHDADSAPVIGYTGARPEDHLDDTVEALRAVCQSTGARFKVVGGKRPPPVGSLEPYMDWVPWRPEAKFSVLDSFDIGIMPLRDTEVHRGKEPLKVKEYMASALPVVASPVGHNLTVIEHGVHGFFADTMDEWVTFLERLVRDADLRAELGANGRRLVEERYDVWPQMRRLVDVFHQVAAER
jgi:glycosyltransferase involved in cell wall biosynthesis